MRHSGWLLASLSLVLSGCASTGDVADPAASSEAALHQWSNVEKLPVGTAIRVTVPRGERFYGRVMQVNDSTLTLEQLAGSESIARADVALVERFPVSLPESVPRAALGVGAALSLSSAASPRTYRKTVAPGQDTLEKESDHTRNGFYVDALALAGTSIEMVGRAIESSRKTVVVYRAR